MRLQIVNVMLFILGLAATPALASPSGELDPAFGDHGRILLRDARFGEQGGVGVFPDLTSGKLLVVTSGYSGNTLLRFDNDGSLDLTFGDRGAVPLAFVDNQVNIYHVAQQPDGKLLIAGAFMVYSDTNNVVHSSGLLARMHADGTPDTAFGGNGRVHLQLGGAYEALSNILLQTDGRIVVFGNTNRSGSVEMLLARYTQDGLLDTSFGGSATPGIGVIDLAGVDARPSTVVQQRDGKFLMCGDARANAGISDLYVIMGVRIEPNGMPDLTFGINGMRLISAGPDSVSIATCMELADGHLIFAGTTGSNERQRAAVWRVTPDGRQDAGFGSNGMTVLDTSIPSSATTMMIMTDGALAIAGTQWQPDRDGWVSWLDMLVTRIDPVSGAIDQGFGDQGMTAIDFGARGLFGVAVPAGLNQQSDGKLVIIGSQIDRYDWYYAYSIAIARVDPYGSGSNGWAGLTETYASATSAGGAISFRVRRTGGSTGQLSVDYRTVGDTAIAGTDYVASSSTLLWADGDLSDKSFSITVLSAPSGPNLSHFSVELFNSSGGLAMDQATIGIRRQSTPAVPPPPPVIGGGGGAVCFELLLLLAVLGLFRAVRRRRIFAHAMISA